MNWRSTHSFIRRSPPHFADDESNCLNSGGVRLLHGLENGLNLVHMGQQKRRIRNGKMIKSRMPSLSGASRHAVMSWITHKSPSRYRYAMPNPDCRYSSACCRASDSETARISRYTRLVLTSCSRIKSPILHTTETIQITTRTKTFSLHMPALPVNRIQHRLYK